MIASPSAHRIIRPKINNPLAHEYTTGPEIVESVTSTPSTAERPSSRTVDALVAGAGTGGTITGLSRAIKKKHNRDCIVVGVDPVWSLHHLPLQPLTFVRPRIERQYPCIS